MHTDKSQLAGTGLFIYYRQTSRLINLFPVLWLIHLQGTIDCVTKGLFLLLYISAELYQKYIGELPERGNDSW